MMTKLWSSNTPDRFWRFWPDPSQDVWREVYRRAIPSLGLSRPLDDIDVANSCTLGEGQFGFGHWKLSPLKRLYYTVKPFLPPSLRYLLRRQHKRLSDPHCQLRWPIEDRYVRFQWEIARQVLLASGQPSLSFQPFWPEDHRYAFVLTHDIETAEGQSFARAIADLEERLGFRSSFNFVPERYDVDIQLMHELRERGFEIGVHGLKHDGKLFSSHSKFSNRCKRINHYLKEFAAVGFRAPLTHRNPEWMQALEIEYDLSFFDTDPYEPMPGGVMSIWPFTIGHFIELPYTLAQDSTLAILLGEKTSKLWLEKLDFIEHYYGMALINSHPDYLKEESVKRIYVEFLETARQRGGYWHALPCEVARWWRLRTDPTESKEPHSASRSTVTLENGNITIY
jgi:peptidoglycan/xylan/chitin deacetylase (PgdA/CDA1 family)